MKTSASAVSSRKPALTPDQIEAREFLRKFLCKGTKVYTVLRHRTPEGTCRFIDLYVLKKMSPSASLGVRR